jgi:hypothetical protein
MAFLTGTFPAATESASSLDSFIPEVWGERINEFFRAKLVAAPFFVNRSSELAGGGDTLYTPEISEMSANVKSLGTAVTLNSYSEVKRTLSVNNWYESSFAIEDLEAAQVKRSYSLMERYSKSAGFAVAKKLDTAVTTLFQSFTNVLGASTNNLGDSDIRAAFAYLGTANVDVDEAAFFVTPNVFWLQVQALDKFSLAVNSPVNDPTAKMPQAYLYGKPVYITTQITSIATPSGGVANALAVPDAIHWATSPLGQGGSKGGGMVGSMGVRVQSNYIPQYLSTVTTADIAYGTVLNRPSAGVLLKTTATRVN